MSNPSTLAQRLLFAVSACAFAMPGYAQTTNEQETRAPAHIAYIDGAATIARDGRAEDANINLPLVAGDRLRTRDGRAEVIFGDGSVLDIDHFTAVDFLSDELLRLLEGRLRLTIAGTPGRDRVSYRIDTPSGAIRIDEPGEYRVALIGESGAQPDVELIAVRGFATLINDLGRTEVSAGERAFASATMAPSYPQAYNSATWDAFDRWVAERSDARTGTTSARYLPEEVRGYSGSFDRYGDWRYEETYGYVWYPRVQVAWRPYYHGRWNYYRPWGWTWIAYDPWWGWPTHHYGRWGFSAGAWFWIPSPYWAPAYVHWAAAPGYVGWCALGWNGAPVFSLNLHFGYGGYGHGNGYHDPYRGWTVMPRHAFAGHRNVPEHAVPRGTIDRAVPRWSVASAAAPVRPLTRAAASTPIYSAGRAAASRRAVPVESGSGLAGVAAAPRAYRRTQPDNSNVPRTTAPVTSGVLGAGASSQTSDFPRARARYRDPGSAAPGGSGQPDARSVPQGTAGVPQDRARSRSAYAPRRVPDAAPGSAPRGVPRAGTVETEPGRRPGGYPRPNEYPPEGIVRPGFDRPVRRSPSSSPPPSMPDGGAGPTYSRPAPPSRGPGTDRPTYSRPAPSPRGGSVSGPSRAVPRGGSTPRPSSGPSQSQPGSGGHSRRR